MGYVEFFDRVPWFEPPCCMIWIQGSWIHLVLLLPRSDSILSALSTSTFSTHLFGFDFSAAPDALATDWFLKSHQGACFTCFNNDPRALSKSWNDLSRNSTKFKRSNSEGHWINLTFFSTAVLLISILGTAYPVLCLPKWPLGPNRASWCLGAGSWPQLYTCPMIGPYLLAYISNCSDVWFTHSITSKLVTCSWTLGIPEAKRPAWTASCWCCMTSKEMIPTWWPKQ